MNYIHKRYVVVLERQNLITPLIITRTIAGNRQRAIKEFMRGYCNGTYVNKTWEEWRKEGYVTRPIAIEVLK